MNFLIPPWVKWAALAALIATLIGFGWWVSNLQSENKTLHAAMNEALRRIDSADAKNVRQDELLAARDQQHQEIRDATADVTVRIKQETAHDAPTRALLDTRIPDSVRRAYSEAAAARASRERANHDSANSGGRPVPHG